MADIANFIAQNSPRFNRAAVDRQHYGNALLRNQVDRLPQQNRAQDLAIQGTELDINQAQRQNATGILGRNFAIAANSPRPREAMRAFLASPDFVAAGKLAGLPVEQFSVTDQDTDDAIRQQAQAWANALSGQPNQRVGVQSAHVTADDTLGYLTDEGKFVDTGQRVRVPREPSEPLVEIMTDDGPMLVPRSRAVGQRPPTAEKPPTEGDKRNALMFDSMVNAEQQIMDLLNAGKTTDTSSFGNAALGAMGLNVMQSDDYKSYEAAGLRWAANQLYLKSGATATPDEIRSTWRQYFPQPGDGPEQVAQKNAARLQEMDSAAAIIGRKSPQFNAPLEFATEQEAAAAAAAGQIKPGQRIKVGGVSGVWQ